MRPLTQRKLLTVLGVGALVATGIYLGRRKKQQGGSAPDYGNLPDPNDLDGPLEPWEEEAAALPGVADGLPDVPVGADADQVGSGHPHELVLPGLEDNPGGVQRNVDESWKLADPTKHPDFAPEPRGVPFAAYPAQTTWPVLTNHPARLVTSYLGKTGWHGNSGRAFKAERYTSEGEKRHHGGIDLWANDGDAVVAPEAGRILAALPYHHGTWAIYLITHDRRVINLGEVKKYSWREFKVSPGDIVSGGQPLARVGLQAGGNTMLHLETYDGSQNTDEELVDMIRKSELRWYADQAPPAILFDPSAYLLITGARTYAEENSAEIVG